MYIVFATIVLEDTEPYEYLWHSEMLNAYWDASYFFVEVLHFKTKFISI